MIDIYSYISNTYCSLKQRSYIEIRDEEKTQTQLNLVISKPDKKCDNIFVKECSYYFLFFSGWQPYSGWYGVLST